MAKGAISGGAARRAAARGTIQALPTHCLRIPPGVCVLLHYTSSTMQACSTAFRPAAATVARPARSAAGLPILAVARPKRAAVPAKAAKKEIQLQSTLAPSESRPSHRPLQRDPSSGENSMPDGWAAVANAAAAAAAAAAPACWLSVCSQCNAQQSWK